MTTESYWLCSAVKVKDIPSFSHQAQVTMSRDSTGSDWELVAAVSLLDGWNMRNFGAVLPNVDNESLETTQQRVITWLKQCIRSYLRVTGTVVSLHSSGEAGEFWLAHEEWVPDK